MHEVACDDAHRAESLRRVGDSADADVDVDVDEKNFHLRVPRRRRRRSSPPSRVRAAGRARVPRGGGGGDGGDFFSSKNRRCSSDDDERARFRRRRRRFVRFSRRARAPTLLCLAPVHDAGPRRLEWRAFVAAWAKMAGRCVEEEEAARIRGSRDQDRARSRSPIRRRPSRGRSRSLSPGPRSREDSARAATARGVFLVDGGGGDEGAIATALADVAPSLGDSVEAAATRCVTRSARRRAFRIVTVDISHIKKDARSDDRYGAGGGGSRGAFEEDREVSGEWGDATGRRGIARTTRCCRREMCCVNVSSTRRGLPPPGGGSPRARRILLRARRRLRVRRTCSPSRRPRFPRRRRGRASRRRRARRRAPRT